MTKLERDVRFETKMLKRLGHTRRELKFWKKLAKKTLAGKMDFKHATDLFEDDFMDLNERMLNMNIADQNSTAHHNDNQ